MQRYRVRAMPDSKYGWTLGAHFASSFENAALKQQISYPR